MPSPLCWLAFAALIGLSVLQGTVFVALRYLVSGPLRKRGRQRSGVWVVFVILFDTTLLGILVAVDIPGPFGSAAVRTGSLADALRPTQVVLVDAGGRVSTLRPS